MFRTFTLVLSDVCVCMYAVPNMAVFCSSLILCFPGILLLLLLLNWQIRI